MSVDHKTTDFELAPVTNHFEVLGKEFGFAGQTVLDVGCGYGALSRWLRSVGAQVLSCDVSSVAIEKARQSDPGNEDAYLIGMGESLPFESDSADFVIYSYSLHHVPMEQMDVAMAEAKRVLRPGGLLVSVEPVADGPGYSVNSLVIDEAEVRAAAQKALDRATEAGFTEQARVDYWTEYVYESFEDWCDQIVSNDSEREEQLFSSLEKCRAEFHRFAERRDNGFAFPQPNILRALVNNT